MKKHITGHENEESDDDIMPVREMLNTGRRLKEQDIAGIEKKLKTVLPEAYRDFLLCYNGGAPEPRYFGDEVLHHFFSLDGRDEVHDLWAHCKLLKDDLPSGVIPIAADTFGNAVCLATKGKNRGKVYFWDHEGGTEHFDVRARYPEIQFKPYEEDEPRPPIKDDWPGHPDLTLIADSFTEFLESFHDQPELDDEPEDEPPEPEADDEPEDEPPGPPPEPAVWPLPGKPRKATKAKTSKAKGGSKVTKAKPRAKKATKARSRDKG